MSLLQIRLVANAPVGFPAVPWQDFDYGDLVLGPMDFSDGIIDSSSSGQTTSLS